MLHLPAVPYLLINQSRHWEAVKAVSERLPQSDIVSTLAFVIKAVYAVNGSAFVVSSEQKEVLGIFDLQQRPVSIVGSLEAHA